MEGGYYQQKRLNPTGVAMVVLLHGVALFALMTARGDIDVIKVPRTVLIDFKDPPPPPKNEPQPKPKPQPRQESVIDIVKPVIEVPHRSNTPIDIADIRVPPAPWTPPGPTSVPEPPPPPIPVHEPVRVEPRIDNSSALQPPYPPSAQREGAEGTVKVRVAIGPDGRVRAVEKLGDGRDDFFAATERQALRYWRFKPATIDGRPIESSKVMTVHFRLDDLG